MPAIATTLVGGACCPDPGWGDLVHTKDQLEAVGKLFGLSITEHERLPSGSNWMGQRYSISTTTGRYFLKIRSHWWPLLQAEYVSELQQYLCRQGFPVAPVRCTVGGGCLAQWEGHICECHGWIEGQPLAAVDLQEVYAAGRSLRTLHALLEGYRPPHGRLPEGCGYPWPTHVRFFADRLRAAIPANSPETAALERVLAAIDRIDAEDVRRLWTVEPSRMVTIIQPTSSSAMARLPRSPTWTSCSRRLEHTTSATSSTARQGYRRGVGVV